MTANIELASLSVCLTNVTGKGMACAQGMC